MPTAGNGSASAPAARSAAARVAAAPQPALLPKYFFGSALWAAALLFAAAWLDWLPITREVLGASIVALVLLALAASWLLEQLDARLRVIADAAEQIAAGGTPVRITDGVELVHLTDALNRMTQTTQDRIADLQSRVEQQRTIAEHGPDAMWVFQLEAFKLVDVNENFARLAGYPRAELLGKTPMDLSPPTQIDQRSTEEHARWIIEGALRGEKIVTRWTLRTRDGEDVPCELRAVQLVATDRTLICGSMMDIRERLRTEAALAEQLRFEALITRLSSRMVRLTVERADEDVNGALADIGQFAGVDRSYLFLYDDSQSRVSCSHEWCAAGIAPQISRLKDLRVADFPWVESQLILGHVVHVPRVAEVPDTARAERDEWQAESIQSLLLVPLRTGERTQGYVGFDSVRAVKTWSPDSIDLLKIFGEIVLNAIVRVRAEAELRQRNDDLARTVQELARSNEELQQFAYIASHDLQEPLRSVGSFSELLERRYADRLDPDARTYLRFLTDAARRMHALINALLDYSRIDARAHPFEACPMDAVLQAALANLDASIRDAAAVVTADPLPTVGGDRAQLTQLLQNLVGNAVKFHGPEPLRVHCSVRRLPQGGWEFTVRDNGIGIDPDDARRLFQIFKRLHGQDRYPGTGIGLAACKRILERHGGRIWVEPNADGPGCSFRFTLPAPRD